MAAFQRRLKVSAAATLRGFVSTPAEARVEPPMFAPFPASIPKGRHIPYRLLESWNVSPDSKILRFELPEEVPSLVDLGVCSSLKVKQEIAGHALDKSYSPVSHPAAEGFVDFLVKRYPFRPGGGLAAFLCDMKPGEEVPIMAKPPRNMGDRMYAANRFKDVVLIGNGTGVAPFLQMGKVVFEDPNEKTRVHFVTGHRTEADMLCQDWIDSWKKACPERFFSHEALSKPVDAAKFAASGGHVGRIDLPLLRKALPEPSSSVLVLVCGTDGFLETMCGMKIKSKTKDHTKKQQGPVTGYLKELGYGEGSGVTVTKL
eukprot:CAMPEP_0206464482 /NCGR_PEP_ID=MMETSP0324_2-20121206/27243_1 /ASSEMBLY_ACC=CAM_ASM_000836 /TAXON_ID=2866 /ORGANISM="Crypthecodinium cohnii, Strain Seligo" /LENGTH=314 /DNA_ID=CAMNT_0053937123 /DNA_START=54 /DNA_END=998 /DNA_ORIENTATION=+